MTTITKTVDFSDVPEGCIFEVPLDLDGVDYTKSADGVVSRDGMISMGADEAADIFAGAQCRVICNITQ